MGAAGVAAVSMRSAGQAGSRRGFVSLRPLYLGFVAQDCRSPIALLTTLSPCTTL
jgi:hypothetical protein